MHKVITSMVEYFGCDVRRINHALKVYGLASTICRCENLCEQDIEVTEIAAVLHDIGILVSEKKYGSCIGKYQELEGPAIAHAILDKLRTKPDTIARVCYLIGNHHTYTKIDGIDFQILVEADFLVNIYEDEMDEKMVKSIKEKYFKTNTGLQLLDSMFVLIS
ncbi:MAG TPA: HD family phosphohydrolase [Prolixibacteraceae bacterium]|nr:HD family phosphohydrolase [Prolixibacteraceae bacterium]